MPLWSGPWLLLFIAMSHVSCQPLGPPLNSSCGLDSAKDEKDLQSFSEEAMVFCKLYIAMLYSAW